MGRGLELLIVSMLFYGMGVMIGRHEITIKVCDQRSEVAKHE